MKCDPSTLPIVMILGAGRSGTNLLADVIGTEPGFHNTVENRYIWNYGQKTLAHDVRGADEATPKVVGFIRDFFARQATKTGMQPLDKTPSNVFRIPFAQAVFPQAKFIHIVRDGRANIYSRVREWHGGNAVVADQQSDGTALLRDDYRSAFVRRRLDRVREMLSSDSLPPSRIPVFLRDNLGPFLRQLLLRETVRYGERFPGMTAHLRAYGTLATGGAQWREGVMQATHAGRRLGPERYIEIHYEDLLDRPAETWPRIAGFLGIAPDGPGAEWLNDNLRPNHAPDWSDPVYAEFLDTVEPFIRPTCEYLGYRWENVTEMHVPA